MFTRKLIIYYYSKFHTCHVNSTFWFNFKKQIIRPFPEFSLFQLSHMGCGSIRQALGVVFGDVNKFYSSFATHCLSVYGKKSKKILYLAFMHPKVTSRYSARHSYPACPALLPLVSASLHHCIVVSGRANSGSLLMHSHKKNSLKIIMMHKLEELQWGYAVGATWLQLCRGAREKEGNSSMQTASGYTNLTTAACIWEL